jgi:hypothetical protein
METYFSELDLYKDGSLRKAFETAGLLVEPKNKLLFPTDDDKRNELDRQARALYHRWFNEQHFYQPLTQRPMMRIAREARNLLLTFFVQKTIPFSDYPLLLWKDLRADFAEKEKEIIQAQRAQLIKVLTEHMQETTDVNDETQLNLEKLRKGEDQRWDVKLKPCPGQSPASVEEQSRTLEGLVEAVNAMVDDSACFVKSPILIGPPGAGKTHLMKLGVLYALSRGLNVSMIALTGELRVCLVLFCSFVFICHDYSMVTEWLHDHFSCSEKHAQFLSGSF